MSSDLQAMLRAEAIKLADSIYEMVVAKVTSAIAGAPPPNGAVNGHGGPAPATEGTRNLVAEQAPRPSRMPPPTKKRRRIPQDELEGVLASVIELLKKNGEMRSEAIRAELGIDKKLFQHAAFLGKQSDQLVQTGERRATVYRLPVTPSRAQEHGRVVRRKKRASA